MKDIASSLPRRFSLALAFGAVAAFGVYLGTATSAVAEPAAPAIKPCTAKKFDFKEVEQACKKGGQKEAKTYMKSVVKKAKAAGEEVTCKSCHKSTKTFELKPNAVADFKKIK